MRLQDHLELVVVLHAVGVFAVTAVGGPAGGLDVRRFPRLRAENAKKRGRMEGPCPNLGIIRLVENAALRGPELL